MTTWTTLRPLTLTAALLATLTLTAPAIAQEPTVPAAADRLLLRSAQGEYLLDDGRTLRVHVGVRRLGVALDERRFTPPNIEARPSAGGARSRSYT